MTDKHPQRNAIGDWSTSPPKVTIYEVIPLEERDPRDATTEVVRDLLIARRRTAGLPDYPLQRQEEPTQPG